MDNTYYFFNALVFLPVLLLSIFSDVKPHKSWKALLAAYACVSLPFIIWDIWAASAEHWGFSMTYITGPYIAGIPVEELLFFITVPFAMMYVWGVIKKHVKIHNISKKIYIGLTCIIIASAVAMLVIGWGGGYSISAAIATLITVILLLKSTIIKTNQFWVFQIVLLGLFLVCNTLLTALPIITYGPNAIIGLRIGTIPIEDFLFNFAFINLFLLTYNKFTTNGKSLTK